MVRSVSERRRDAQAGGRAPTAMLGAFTFLFATSQVRNFDIWWHLRTGEWILENGRVPRADPFSFTAGDTPWVVHYWLTDVLFAWLNRAVGINGLILLCAAVVAASVVIIHRIMVRRGVDPFVSALLLGVAVVAARFRFMVRPHAFMFLFSALFLWVLTSDLRTRPKRLLWLLPIMLVWVNMHGSFILALVFAGAFFAQELLDAVRGRGVGSDARGGLLLWAGATLLALGALVFVSPFGVALPVWVVQDFTSHAVTRSFELEEHAALAWGSRPLVWGLLIAAAASFAVAWSRIRVFDLLVFAALAVLALRSVRMAALGSIVFAMVLGFNLRPVIGPSLVSGRVGRVLAAGLLSVAAVLAFLATYTPEKVYRFGLGVMASRYPVAAAGFLRDVGFEGNVLNTWEFGGYLLWSVPGVKTFADGRTLPGHMSAVDRTKGMAGPELGAFLEERDVRALFIRPGEEPYASFAGSTTAYQPVFLDDQAAVYLRRDVYAAFAEAGRIEGFRWIRPGSTDISYLSELALGEHAAEAEAELRRAVELAPRSFQPRYLLGLFLEAQGRPDAVDAFADAAAISPALAFTHYDLGRRAARLALRHQEWEKAVDILRQSLPFGESAEGYFLLGTALQMTARFEDAESAFRRVLEQEPENVGSLVNLGFVYLDTNRADMAVEAFTTAARLAPEEENALYGLALAHQRLGRSEEAAQLWRDFLARFPSSRWTQNARGFLAQTEG